MNKLVIGIIAVLISIVAMIMAVVVISYISANNYGAKVEADLVGARDNNMNILGQYYAKINEAAQVPAMYKDDFKEIVEASMQGRYGDNGSQAMFQWLQEHDIKIDSAMYIKLQQLIEGGRKDFEIAQTRMIDIRKGYEAQLNFFWRGMWLRITGYPKVNLADFKPVTSDRVEAVYKDLKEVPLTLRK